MTLIEILFIRYRHYSKGIDTDNKCYDYRSRSLNPTYSAPDSVSARANGNTCHQGGGEILDDPRSSKNVNGTRSVGSYLLSRGIQAHTGIMTIQEENNVSYLSI